MAIQDLQDYKGRSEDTPVSEQAQSNCGKPGYPVQGKGYAQYFTKEGRRKLPYEVFLKTGYWYQVKQIVLKRDRHRCTACKTHKDLQVHHKTYEHRGDEFNHLDDVVTLCKNCHAIAHEQYTLDTLLGNEMGLLSLVGKYPDRVAGLIEGGAE